VKRSVVPPQISEGRVHRDNMAAPARFTGTVGDFGTFAPSLTLDDAALTAAVGGDIIFTRAWTCSLAIFYRISLHDLKAVFTLPGTWPLYSSNILYTARVVLIKVTQPRRRTWVGADDARARRHARLRLLRRV
jgi:hypothetical protein